MTATIPAALPNSGIPMDARRPNEVVADDAFAQALDRARPDEHNSPDARMGARSRHAAARTDRPNRSNDRESHEVADDSADPAETNAEAVRSERASDEGADDTAAVATPLSGSVPVAMAGVPRVALDVLRRVIGDSTDANLVTAAPTGAADDTPRADGSLPLAARTSSGPTGASADDAGRASIADSLAATDAGTAADAPVDPIPLAPATVGVSDNANDADPQAQADIAADRDIEPEARREIAGVASSLPTDSVVAIVDPATPNGGIDSMATAPPAGAAEVVATPTDTDSVDDIAALTTNRAALTVELGRRSEAPAAPAATAPAPSRNAAPAEQVVHVLSPLRLRGDGNYDVRLELKPPELGRVEIRVEMRDGVLHAHLRAEQPAAAMALRDSLTQLRDHLAGHGVQAGTLDVDTNGAGGQRQGLDLAGDAGDSGDADNTRDAHAGTTSSDRAPSDRRTRPARTARTTYDTNRLDIHA